MNTYGERLNWAMGKRNKTRKEVGHAIGISETAVGMVIRGDTQGLSTSNHYAACEYLAISDKWLKTGDGDPFNTNRASNAIESSKVSTTPTSEHVEIKVWGVELSAGNGVTIPTYTEDEDSDAVVYKREYLQKLGINPKNCKRFKVRGSSMEKTLYHEDEVLVDTADKIIREGKVYAIVLDKALAVKRLFPLPSNGVRIFSDNSKFYPEMNLTESEAAETLQIIGRVRDKSGAGGLDGI